MKIHPAKHTVENGLTRVQADLEVAGRHKTLWFAVDEKYCPFLSNHLDAFVVGLWSLASELGENIEVLGTASEKLCHNLNLYFSPLYQQLTGAPKAIKVVANSACSTAANIENPIIVTGFSAGVDSFCAIRDHFQDEQSPNYKVTHFIFNNVGSHGTNAEKSRALFNSRYVLNSDFPREVGIEMIKIDSNLGEILTQPFQQTHTLRNVAAVLLLQKAVSKYYYSSAYQYSDCFVGPSKDIAFMDPFAAHLLSTESLEVISTGSQYSRVEKTRLVAGTVGADRYLNVCTSPLKEGKNCSKCKKCRRTLFTLDILGELEKFSKIFDLARWKKGRGKYIIGTILLKSNDPFVREIREYMKAHGITVSIGYYVAAGLLFPFSKLKDMSRNFFRKIRISVQKNT